MRLATPTPIQSACLPAALHGRKDVVGAAETGSGKTLAFGLPILQRLMQERDDQATADYAVQVATAAYNAAGGKTKASGGNAKPERDLFALIIAPTRELSNQVAEMLKAVAPSDVGIVSLVGGMSIDKQRRLLSRRPEIVVGTPGRLWEFCSDGMTPYLTQMSSIQFLVLDEVDRMVEAGHFRELRSILNLIEKGSRPEDEEGFEAPMIEEVGAEHEEGDEEEEEKAEENQGGDSGALKRQTFLFSATLMLPPKAREANAKRIAKHKQPVTTPSQGKGGGGNGSNGSGNGNGGGGAMDSIMKQIVFRNPLKLVDLSRKQLVTTNLEQAQLTVQKEEKDAFLFLLLRTRLSTGRTIVFTNAVTALVRLRSLLSILDVPHVLALQGNMQQRARLKALDRFKGLPTAVLLATDVAARGLDISGVDHVVHYQLPRSAEVYVHRSGRTARGGACGLSIALIEPSDNKGYRRLCFELEMPDGLPELTIESKRLPKIREALSLARQLDRTAHAASKQTHAKNERAKLREEMGLPSDSEDDDDGEDGGDEVAKRHARRQKEQTERSKAQLKRLLARMDRPEGGTAVHVAAANTGKW